MLYLSGSECMYVYVVEACQSIVCQEDAVSRWHGVYVYVVEACQSIVCQEDAVSRWLGVYVCVCS